MKYRTLAMIACSALVVPLVSCGDDESSTDSTAATTDAPATTDAAATTEVALAGTLTVMAPGPFKGLLEAATAEFEAAHPDVTVELNLGHVPTLLTQLEEGVVADVLITPDAGTMGQEGPDRR